MKNNGKKLIWFKWSDLFAVFAVLILALYFILSPKVMVSSETKNRQTPKLILINERETINLQWENGNIDLEKLINKKMIVEIQNNKARVISSNCPDKVCIHTGWVSDCGHIAACLPNGVALLVDCSE